MLLATILSPLVTLLGALALLERSRAKQQIPAKSTRKRHEADFVTREELEEAIDKATKDITFEWNEMYEKFEKLHLRLSKRDQRAKQQQQQPQQLEQLGFDDGAPEVGVLSIRRQGSI